MRRVRVMGSIHDIPDDREYIVQGMEMDRPDRRTTYQYRFPEGRGTAVRIQKCTEDLLLGYGQDQALAHPQDWEQLPPKHINEFLLVEPGQEYTQSFRTKKPTTAELDEHYYRYGAAEGMKTGRHTDHYVNVDMSSAENRFLAALDEPMKKQVNKKKTKRSAKKSAAIPSRMSMQDPAQRKGWFSDDIIKEAAYGTYNMPTFEEPEGEDMSDQTILFPAGTRVTFRDPNSDEWVTATVVGRTPEMRGKTRQGCILVATDKSSKYNSSNTKYTGRNHGTIVDIDATGMQLMDDPQWELVPEHIGIVVRKGFRQDDVKIPTSATGRILNYSQTSDDQTVGISWNFSNANFSSNRIAGKERHNIWEVPAAKVRLCTLNGGEAVTLWPSSFGERVEFKAGDLCKVAGRSVSFCDDQNGDEHVVPGDTVVELLEYSGDRYKTWHCRIIGGCADELVGQALKIRANHMRSHPKPDLFYRAGQTVEIVAEIDFRKKPLQGMKGRVILSTDAEGDVGIEFTEDIDAGSLDGIGKEGHCIYIEASLVKSSE